MMTIKVKMIIAFQKDGQKEVKMIKKGLRS